jgi:hypothetical protein
MQRQQGVIMRRVFRAVGLAIVLAAAFSISVPVAHADFEMLAPEDPPGETCFHFPGNLTVCCGGGGCHIL